MLDEGVKTHIEEKRTEAVTLEHATANWYEGSADSGVIIEVLLVKLVYKLPTINLMWLGTW